MTAIREPAVVAVSAPAPATGGFRPDIEGLRAVAVVLVVLSHAGVAGLAGGYVGVDVFFVISGFLITSLLLRELADTGRVSIGRFYARRAMRLLPASTLVLAATMLGAWWWLTPLRTAEYAGDAIASAFSTINIRLALAGTDYLAADATPSPFQHFWSLAVEEQFYLFWPLLIVATGAAHASWRRRRVTLAVVLCALTVASFAASVWQTGVSAPWAYFGAHTRAWELGVGALLALSVTRLRRLPPRPAALLGWAGLVAILASAVAFDESTAFPGAWAALPVGGAAAIIVAGANQPRCGVPALLGWAPFQAIGRLSYGLYLWHWPLLMIAPTALGIAPAVGLHLLLCAAALGLAWCTFRLVENPMRHRRALRQRPWQGLALGLSLSGTVAALAFAAGAVPHAVPTGGRADDLPAAMSASLDPTRTLLGAVRRARDVRVLPANLTPALTRAAYDQPRVYADGCHVDAPITETAGACAYGDPAASTTVVLFGDSHAAQWFPALQQLAESHHWRLISLTKSACTATDAPIMHETLKRPYTECLQWHRATIARIARLAPDLIVVATSFAYRLVDAHTPAATQWSTAWDSTLSDLRRTGARVAVLADTPYQRGRVPACLSQWSSDIGHCASPRRLALRNPEQRKVVLGYAGSAVTVIDPTPWMCVDVCPTVLGNVLVYRDSSHLTTVFSRALAPLLDARLPLLG